MRKTSIILTALLLTMVITCTRPAEKSGQTAAYGTIPVRLIFPGQDPGQPVGGEGVIVSAAGDGTCLECDHIDFIVTGSGMAETPFLDIDYSLHGASLDGIPAGGGRAVTCNVYNAINSLLYTGSAAGITVPAGGAAPTQNILLEATDRADWYVDGDAAGNRNGTSWADAFPTIQEAVHAASIGDNIFVAEGVYTAKGGTPVLIMKAGVGIYGGFTGTEKYLSERGNPADHPSVLDGKYISVHTVVGASNAKLDGFTVIRGYAHSLIPESCTGDPLLTGEECRGGGFYASQISGAVISNCIFKDNFGVIGAGVSADNFSLLDIKNCTFRDNRTPDTNDSMGGAIFNARSSITITGSEFYDNYSGGSGGGIIAYRAVSEITGCVFESNFGTGGGAIGSFYSYMMVNNTKMRGNTSLTGSGIFQAYSGTVMMNVLIDDNTSVGSGGGIASMVSSLEMVNCTISGNSAVEGGGMYNQGTDVAITNSIVWGNQAGSNPTMANYIGTTLAITYSDIQGNGSDPPNGNIDAAPAFVAPTKGNFHLLAGSPCIDAADPDPMYNDPDGSRGDMGAFGGNTRVQDSDHDGMENWWETLWGYNPSDPSDAAGDTDGDLITNLAEFNNGSDPTVANLPRIYVDNSATGLADGSSWTDAYTGIQDAVDAAIDGAEIWVAQGTYTGEGGAVVYMKNGVDIFGGFAGTETDFSQRIDPSLYPTIIDGEDSRRGVQGASNAALDGFTVQNCRSFNSSGAGMYNSGISVLVVGNCVFDSNAADYYGGGMYNLGASPKLNNCDFNSNTASMDGGGMYNRNASPEITNCDFTANYADSGPIGGETVIGVGGGIYNEVSSSVITGCNFIDNHATQGAGIFNIHANPTIVNSTFSSNIAYYDQDPLDGTNLLFVGGGGIANFSSEATITNCTFDANESTVVAGFFSYGGGIYNYDYTDATITGCTFTANWAPCGAGLANVDNSSPTISTATFMHNIATEGGGGMYNLQSNPIIADCTIESNTAYVYGGGMYNDSSQPTLTNIDFIGNNGSAGGGMCSKNSGWASLTNCTFDSNSANEGGGMALGLSASVTTTYCYFIRNRAYTTGGGIYGLYASSLTARKTEFLHNRALEGGAIYLYSGFHTFANVIAYYNIASQNGGALYTDDATLTIQNCTLFGNVSALDGGFNYISNAAVNVDNSIVWANNGVQGDDNWLLSSSTLNVNYSDVQGGAGGGTGNINSNPLFLAAPVFVDVTWNDSTALNQIQVSDNTIYTVGHVIEIDNDAVPRTILSLDPGDKITFTPAMTQLAVSYMLVADWGTGVTDVKESFKLQSGSPCVNFGTTIPEITDDFFGNPRPSPSGGIYDMGAYEYPWP